MKILSRALLIMLCLQVLLASGSAIDPVQAQGSGGQTTLKVYNASNNAVQVWLTLSSPIPQFVNNVAALPFKPPVSMVGSGLQGNFSLGAGKSTTLKLPVGQGISGNFCFGAAPLNCPPSGFPNGVNLAEFTLNCNTPPFSPTFTQEAIDISCVSGVNADIRFDMYPASGSGPWGNPFSGTVQNFENKPFGTPATSPNKNIPGVFPTACQDCTGPTGPDVCPPNGPTSPPWQGSAQHVCNIQRPSANSGGTVQITFKGFFTN